MITLFYERYMKELLEVMQERQNVIEKRTDKLDNESELSEMQKSGLKADLAQFNRISQTIED